MNCISDQWWLVPVLLLREGMLVSIEEPTIVKTEKWRATIKSCLIHSGYSQFRTWPFGKIQWWFIILNFNNTVNKIPIVLIYSAVRKITKVDINSPGEMSTKEFMVSWNSPIILHYLSKVPHWSYQFVARGVDLS